MRVLKWNISVDDNEHEIGAGEVVKVACQNSPAVVQVWTIEYGTDESIKKVPVRVYGTGHTIPDGYKFIGTAVTEYLVWHVFYVQ